MCPAPTTMTDSIIATQRTRDRTFFCAGGRKIYWDFTGFFAKLGGRGGDVCYNRKQNDRLGTDGKERCV